MIKKGQETKKGRQVGQEPGDPEGMPSRWDRQSAS